MSREYRTLILEQKAGPRPRTLPQMRQFHNRFETIARRVDKSREIDKLTGGTGALSRRQSQQLRAVDISRGVLAKWEKSKRPPKGFRLGAKPAAKAKARKPRGPRYGSVRGSVFDTFGDGR